MKKFNTSILFLIFNRPEETKRVFESIKEAKPSKLYLASDGPRSHVIDEEKIVSEVKLNVLNAIDWDCEVKTLFREKNLGCKIAVSEAISWFFDHEDQGIILEDDCLPSQSFYRFCEELLNIYKNDLRIWHISGDNFQNGIARSEESYYYSKFSHVWGWATWKDRWQHYDVMMKSYKNFKKNRFIRSVSNNKKMQNNWLNVFERAANQEIDTWDYQWTYTIRINNGLSIIPEKNLVTNIGFGEGATHTKSVDSDMSLIEKYELEWPLKHPLFTLYNYDADEYTANQKVSFYGFLKSKILKLMEFLK